MAERHHTGILVHGLEDPVNYLRRLGAGLLLLVLLMIFAGAFGGDRQVRQGGEVLPGTAEASLEANWPARSSTPSAKDTQDKHGMLVFVRQISVTFAATATIGEANAALARVGGEIVQSSDVAQRQLEVEVRRELSPRDACELLRGQPGIVSAVPRVLYRR